MLWKAVALERMEDKQRIQTGIPMSAMKKRDNALNALIWVSERRISEQEAGAAVMPPHSTLETPSAVRAGCLSLRGQGFSWLSPSYFSAKHKSFQHDTGHRIHGESSVILLQRCNPESCLLGI